jgi:hypothetical protein
VPLSLEISGLIFFFTFGVGSFGILGFHIGPKLGEI